jgi:hypothetical protein
LIGGVNIPDQAPQADAGGFRIDHLELEEEVLTSGVVDGGTEELQAGAGKRDIEHPAVPGPELGPPFDGVAAKPIGLTAV